jgi:Domain of unknown function (DUF4276)
MDWVTFGRRTLLEGGRLMPKINVLVEGQTEETFVRDVVNPYFCNLHTDSYLSPIILQTKRVFDGTTWKGGLNKYRQFRDQAMRLLGDNGAVALTSVIDVYGLPRDFPGFAASLGMPYRERVRALESALADDLGDERFLPYMSTHEFEALILADPAIVAEVVGAPPARAAQFSAAIQLFANPEEVNAVAPPSKRLLEAFPQYDKVRHGPISATRIGLDRIRDACEHFAEWIAHLDELCRP